MPVIDSTTINRFFNEGEVECSVEKPFLVDRLSLALTGGLNTYTLPDYVTSIRRMTYLGIGLDPLPRRNQREVFQNSTQQGTPFWYIYNNVGQNTVQLFPTPEANYAAVTGDLYLQANIVQGFVVEFSRVSDNQNFIIPPTLRRQLLKKYVAANAFLIDNRNVNLRVSQYFLQRWSTSKEELFELLDDLYNQPRRLVINDFNTFNFFPGSPVLPINRFGISVAEGE